MARLFDLSMPESSSMASASTQLALSGLPQCLFNAWRLNALDISEAQERDDLQGWTVSSLCSTYLNYQLERHDRWLDQVRAIATSTDLNRGLGYRNTLHCWSDSLITRHTAAIVFCTVISIHITQNPIRSVEPID